MAAGIAEYFGIDVALVRVLWLLSIFLGGGGILAYIIAWIAIPEEDEVPYGAAGARATDSSNATASDSGVTPDGTGAEDSMGSDGQYTAASTARVHPEHGPVSRNNGLSYLGLFLILAGIWLVLKAFLPWRLSLYAWPVFLIALGIVLLIPRRSRP